MGSEALYICPRCRETESFLYNDFDEIVSYVHCQCKKPKKPDLINGMKPLDYAFFQLDEFLKQEKERKNALS